MCYDLTAMRNRLSLYVHIPFCRAKCAYCDFNSYAGQESLIPDYVDALLREATFWTQRGLTGPVDTVYLGGGTPSLLPILEAERLLDGLRERFGVAEDAEITMEANPESADTAKLTSLRRAGVNRLSIGVQSFGDEELRFLGRIHNAAKAREAYHSARVAGFDNVSLDLIFGLPDQTMERWRGSLEKAIALGPDHLSLYALTVEEDTPLGRRIEAGECPAPDPDVQAEMYTWSSQRLAATGYEQYEISNWAKPGRRSRHNMTYWETRPYLGLGAGAHSYVDGRRWANERQPRDYIRLLDGSERTQPPRWLESSEEPDAAREMSDAIILGLRLTEGLSLDRLSERFGIDVGERYVEEIADLRRLRLLDSSDGRIRLTEHGRLLGNEAFERFLP
jgi:oxygen-independent coproporphyrinogen III oxidase